MQLEYKKCQYLEIPEKEKDYQKMKYQPNHENKEQYKKRYKENPELHKKFLKSQVSGITKKRKKIVIRLTIFLNK